MLVKITRSKRCLFDKEEEMQSRMGVAQWGVMIFGVAVFFASTEIAWAASQTVQRSCTLQYENGSPYTPTTIVTAQDPVQVSSTLTRWDYVFSQPMAKTNAAYLLAPATFPAAGYSVKAAGKVFPPGGGAIIENFGEMDFENYVIRLDQSNTTYSFYTSSQTLTSSVNDQNGLKTLVCPDIAVPITTGNVAVASSQVTLYNGATFCKNGTVVVDCVTGQTLPSKNLSDLSLDGNALNLVQLPGLGPQDFVLQAGATAIGDPTYYCVAGRCYYLVTPIP